MTSRGSPPHISHALPAHGHRLCPPGASLHRQSAHARLHQQPAPAASPQLISPGPLLAGHSSLSPSSGPAHLPVTVPVPLLFSAFPGTGLTCFRHSYRSSDLAHQYSQVCTGSGAGLFPVLYCQLMSLARWHVARRLCRWTGLVVPVMGGPGLQGALIMGLMGLNLFYACQRPASGAALFLPCVTCCAVLFCANVAGGLCSREYY